MPATSRANAAGSVGLTAFLTGVLLTGCGEFKVDVQAYVEDTQVAQFHVVGTADLSPILGTALAGLSPTPGPALPSPTPTASPPPRASLTPSPTPIPSGEGIIVEGVVNQTTKGIGMPGIQIFLSVDDQAESVVAITGPEGRYASDLIAVAPGSVIHVRAEGQARFFSPKSQSWKYQGGVEVRRLDFVAVRQVRVRGRVVLAADGSGMADVPIWMRLDGGAAEALATTDAQGSFDSGQIWLPEGAEVETYPEKAPYQFTPKGLVWVNDPPRAIVEIDFSAELAGVTPSPGAPEGKIAFNAYDPSQGNWDIWMIRPDGSGLSRLTEHISSDQMPALSPDGSRLAFVSEREGNPDIYVMNIDGSDLRRVTSHPEPEYGPRWSPDGSRLAFSSSREGNSEIYAITLDGGRLTNLSRNPAEDCCASWSPDGSRLVFVSWRGSNADLFLMNADGSEQTRLTRHTGPDMGPAWSPDGQRIAFVSDRDGSAQVYVMAADGTGATRLTDHSTGSYAPAWSPDGARLAYSSGADGLGNIYIMFVDGSDQHRLTFTATSNGDPSWGP